MEALRSWGYRMYEFRDTPIKRKTKRIRLREEKRKENNDYDSLEEYEEDQEEEEKDEKKTRKEKKEKPKSMLKKVGILIKSTI